MALQSALKKCSLFSSLSDSLLENISRSAAEKQYAAGSTLIQEGDTAEELHVLQEGKVAIQIVVPRDQGPAGRKVTVDIVGANECLGWAALLEPHTHSITGVCLQKVKVLSISGARLRLLIQDNPRIGSQIFQELVKTITSKLDETRQVLISERLSVGLK
ncbi:MAG: cyclic nucleotide-binding domain-containing protein [Dehalococcoidia bacterium]|nr:cyclic nucleotide-binding domain-containing protein [Dehalococcoidia bacterium]MDZ4247084.1 cyclic nucleotide-binding domain-containing protein [Dehalococcoidia bacterium]